MDECKYLEIEEVTSYHPCYKYHCTEKNKDLPFGILQCHKCKYYEKRLISD